MPVSFMSFFMFFFLTFCAHAEEWQKVSQITHKAQIGAMAASDELPLIVTGGEEADLFVWETNSMKLLRQIEGHNDRIDEIEFLSDGTEIASLDSDGHLIISNAVTGEIRFKSDSNVHVHTIAVSPDKTRIFAYTTHVRDNKYFEQLQLMNTQGDLISEVVSEIRLGLSSPKPVFSFDGSKVYIANFNKVDIRDADTLTLMNSKLLFPTPIIEEKGAIGLTEAISGLFVDDQAVYVIFREGYIEAFSHDLDQPIWRYTAPEVEKNDPSFQFAPGIQLRNQTETNIILTVDRESVFLDKKSGQIIQNTDPVYEYLAIRRSIQLKDGRIAFPEKITDSGFSPETISIFDTKNNQLLNAEPSPLITIDAVAGCSNEPVLAMGSRNLDQIRIFNIENLSFINEFGAHGIGATQLSIDGNCQKIAAVDMGATGTVWDIKSGDLTRLLWTSTFTQMGIQLSKDGERVLMNSQSSPATIMTVQNRKENLRYKIDPMDEDGEEISFAMPVMSPDGNIIAIGSSDHGVRLYKNDGEQTEYFAKADIGGLPWQLTTIPTGEGFLVGNHSGEVFVVNWSGEIVKSFPPLQPNYPNQHIGDMVGTQDGRGFYSTDDGGRVCYHSMNEIQRECFDETGRPGDSIALVGSDRWLAVAFRDAVVRIYDTTTKEEVYRINQTKLGGQIVILENSKQIDFGIDDCVEVNGIDWRECDN